MKEIDLLEIIQKEKINYQTSKDSDKLNDVVVQFFERATPLDIRDYLYVEDGTLPGKTLTYAILELFKNKNTQSIETFFSAFEQGKFNNQNEVDWNLIFNSLEKSAFQQNNVVKVTYHEQASINKNSLQIKLIEKFGNLENIFKEEDIDYIGKNVKTNNSPLNDLSYETYAERKYGGSYYQHLTNNPDKVAYLLEKELPFSQIKNLFFEAIRKEDTKTIAKVLHSKYSMQLAKDSDVHTFFLLDVPENDKLMGFKKEVLMLIQEIERHYKEMLEEKNDRKFLKHKKI